MDPLKILELDSSKGAWAHAYLFIGRSQDKIELLVLYLRENIGCLPADVTYLASTDETGKKGEIKVAAVRQFLHELSLSSLGSCRIGIIENAEKLNLASANILLKTLEEPPKNVYLVLVSKTEDVLPTIRSRCRVIKVQKDDQVEDSHIDAELLLGKSLYEAFKEIELIAKDNLSDHFFSAFLMLGRKMMIREKNAKTANFLLGVEKKRKEVENNANQRLAMEAVYLKAKELQ
ncbi:MAG: hypothetical protein WC107_02350 [Patescibacteria group bacterium]